MDKLPQIIEQQLLKILLESKEANLILLGYAEGKELKGKISLQGSFSLIGETNTE